MRDLALDSPLLLCLLVVIVGATASLVPLSPVEPVLVGVAAVAPPWLLLPILILATVSHMSTKMLIFVGGTKVERAFTGKGRERFDRARDRLSGRTRVQQGTLFLSSVTGLPPFYLMTALCGSLKMPTRQYVVLATTGRAIRFAALIFIPQLFRPVVAAAQSTPPAVRSVGSGSQTYVLVSGMVGGVAGFRRIESRLVARGYRVVSIDPYQLAVDSENVSFDAMSRLVDAEMARMGIASARVVGHSHGGGVALRLAALPSSRVSALYLLDVGAMESNRGAVFGGAIRLVPLIAQIPSGRSFIRSRIVAGLRENSAGAGWLDAATCHAYADPLLDHIGQVVAMAIRLSSADEPEPVSAVVSRIRVPVTVLRGDVQTKAGPAPDEFTRLARLGGRFRIERIAGAGHFPHEESPDAVVGHLVRVPQVVAAILPASRP